MKTMTMAALSIPWSAPAGSKAGGTGVDEMDDPGHGLCGRHGAWVRDVFYVSELAGGPRLWRRPQRYGTASRSLQTFDLQQREFWFCTPGADSNGLRISARRSNRNSQPQKPNCGKRKQWQALTTNRRSRSPWKTWPAWSCLRPLLRETWRPLRRDQNSTAISPRLLTARRRHGRKRPHLSERAGFIWALAGFVGALAVGESVSLFSIDPHTGNALGKFRDASACDQFTCLGLGVAESIVERSAKKALIRGLAGACAWVGFRLHL